MQKVSISDPFSIENILEFLGKFLEKLDHMNINRDVEFMKGKMASTELLCIEIFNQLKAPIEAHEGVFLHSIKLYETENNSAEYFGE